MIDKIRKRMKFERMDLFGTAYLGQLLPEALAHMPYAIVIGVRMSEAVVDQITTGPTHIYFHNYRTANAVLDRCTFFHDVSDAAKLYNDIWIEITAN